VECLAWDQDLIRCLPLGSRVPRATSLPLVSKLFQVWSLVHRMMWVTWQQQKWWLRWLLALFHNWHCHTLADVVLWLPIANTELLHSDQHLLILKVGLSARTSKSLSLNEGFRKWGYPKSSIEHCLFSTINHPAITNQAKLGPSARKTKSLSLNGVILTLTYKLLTFMIVYFYICGFLKMGLPQ